jgi:hypothetical protein
MSPAPRSAGRTMSPRHLIALLAPGSVEAAVSGIQNALFAEHGRVSAIALQPLIPIGFIGEADAAERFDEVCGGARSPYLFRTRGLRWEAGGLFMAVDSGGVWPTLRERVLRDRLRGGEIDAFPVAEGFILGFREPEPDAKAALRSDAPETVFSSCSAALISIHAAWEEREGWRELSLEILRTRPLR